MNTTTRLTRGPALWLALFLLLLAVGFRLLRATLLPELPNFSPVMAIALCGALVLPRSLATIVPLAALIVTDLLLNAAYGWPLFGPEELLRYACYGLAVASGLSLHRLHAGTAAVFGGVTANTLLFYIVTNTGSWLANPAYAKTAAGWFQALTVGMPGFPPTVLFLGYSLVSNLLFTAVFLAAIRACATAQARPAHA